MHAGGALIYVIGRIQMYMYIQLLKYCTYVPLFASPVGVFPAYDLPTSLVDHSTWSLVVMHLENVGVLSS